LRELVAVWGPDAVGGGSKRGGRGSVEEEERM